MLVEDERMACSMVAMMDHMMANPDFVQVSASDIAPVFQN